jgi:hypothetical protein
MAISGRSFDPTNPPAEPARSVDYRLARRSVLAALRRGVLASSDVCDAHPELLRAGRNIGTVVDDPCPVCSHDTMRRVRYVYGDELKHNNGRVVYPDGWLTELTQNYDQFTCYVVEVCVDCAWNHLIRSFSAGRRYAQVARTGERP